MGGSRSDGGSLLHVKWVKKKNIYIKSWGVACSRLWKACRLGLENIYYLTLHFLTAVNKNFKPQAKFVRRFTAHKLGSDAQFTV